MQIANRSAPSKMSSGAENFVEELLLQLPWLLYLGTDHIENTYCVRFL
jgi:hypothetical protein